MSNSTLQTVFSRSFTGSSAFECSLVKDVDPQKPVYRDTYHGFLSIIPSEGSGGDRKFNPSARITLKASCDQILALSHSLRMWAQGHGQTFGKFTIFADPSRSNYGSGGDKKQIFLGSFVKGEGSQNEEAMVSINFKTGTNKPIPYTMGIPMCLAVSDILKMIAEKGLELEFKHRSSYIGTQQPKKQPQQQNNGNTGSSEDALRQFGDAVNAGSNEKGPFGGGEDSPPSPFTSPFPQM